MRKYLINNVSLYGQSPTDMVIEDGVITAIGDDATRATGSQAGASHPAASDSHGTQGFQRIDASGLIALPGMVDLHTHVREPGREEAETVATASAAAARGGFTAIHAMANSSPVADTAGVVEQVYRLGQQAGLCEVLPVGAVSRGLAGQKLSEMGAMADSAAQVRMFSDDGHCVSDALLMRRALEYSVSVGGFIAQHAQEPRLTESALMNEGPVSARLGLPGWPAVAEEAIIARDVLLADHVGAQLHICHVSTAGSVEVIRWAKSRGIHVSAEVTPHHLLLTDELISSYDPVYKVNPPLRSETDVHALREALAEGIIDVVATDHAPHPAQAKECEFSAASMGMTGLETALPVINATMVQTGLIDWRRFAQITSGEPARIYGHHRHGQHIEVGAPAQLILIDPTTQAVVDPQTHSSKGRNSPFAGLELPGSVRYTFFNGEPVVVDGTLEQPERSVVRS